MWRVYWQVTETHTETSLEGIIHPIHPISTHCEYVSMFTLHPLQELGSIFSKFKRVSQPRDQSFVQRRLVSGPNVANYNHQMKSSPHSSFWWRQSMGRSPQKSVSGIGEWFIIIQIEGEDISIFNTVAAQLHSFKVYEPQNTRGQESLYCSDAPLKQDLLFIEYWLVLRINQAGSKPVGSQQSSEIEADRTHLDRCVRRKQSRSAWSSSRTVQIMSFSSPPCKLSELASAPLRAFKDARWRHTHWRNDRSLLMKRRLRWRNKVRKIPRAIRAKSDF